MDNSFTPRSLDQMVDIYYENYDYFFYLFTCFLTDYVQITRKNFHGDVDLAKVFGVVAAQQMRLHQIEHEKGIRKDVRHYSRIQARAWVNASSIAEVTGIPRETVRRKLFVLQAYGWVEMDARGRVAVGRTPDGTVAASVALPEMHHWTAVNLCRFVLEFMKLMDRFGDRGQG